MERWTRRAICEATYVGRTGVVMALLGRRDSRAAKKEVNFVRRQVNAKKRRGDGLDTAEEDVQVGRSQDIDRRFSSRQWP